MHCNINHSLCHIPFYLVFTFANQTYSIVKILLFKQFFYYLTDYPVQEASSGHEHCLIEVKLFFILLLLRGRDKIEPEMNVERCKENI